MSGLRQACILIQEEPIVRKAKPFLIIHDHGRVFFTYGTSARELKKEHKANGEKLIFCKQLSGALLPLGMLAGDDRSEFSQAMEEFMTDMVREIAGMVK